MQLLIRDLLFFIFSDIFSVLQNELLPASERMPAHTKKKTSGPYDRKHLLKHLSEQAEKSTVGDDYVPFVKKQPPKETKPKVRGG